MSLDALSTGPRSASRLRLRRRLHAWAELAEVAMGMREKDFFSLETVGDDGDNTTTLMAFVSVVSISQQCAGQCDN